MMCKLSFVTYDNQFVRQWQQASWIKISKGPKGLSVF